MINVSKFLTRTIALACATAVALTSIPSPAFAQKRSGSESRVVPVRDAEVEELMRDYARPILRAAGLDPRAVEIVLIRDMSFNAFVANGQRIFINLGAIVESETPNELIGVIAHETGHIAGGHLATLRSRLEAAQNRSIIAMLLGAAAVAGAAAGGAGGNMAGAGMAAITAPQEMVKRDLLAYVRGQEQTADQSAVNYLNKTGQSARGMLETFRRLSEKSMFSSRFMDPYAVTHPLPQDRIALLERIARASPHFAKSDPPALMHRHEMARAKTLAFMGNRNTVARRYRANDSSMPARYARAILAYRFGDVDAAQRDIDSLIASDSGNAYFWELKGQALLEAGRAREAIAPLRRAVSLKPEAGLLRTMLGQALVASGDKSQLSAAVKELRQAIQRERTSAQAYRYLSMAHSRLGDQPEADLAAAQAAFHDGQFESARGLAARAQKHFPTGSPGWLRADDIASYRPPRLN